jgi:hypothetical protein
LAAITQCPKYSGSTVKIKNYLNTLYYLFIYTMDRISLYSKVIDAYLGIIGSLIGSNAEYGRMYEQHGILQELYEKRDEFIETMENLFGVNYGEKPRIDIGDHSLIKDYFQEIIVGLIEKSDMFEDVKIPGDKNNLKYGPLRLAVQKILDFVPEIYKNIDSLYDDKNHRIIVTERIMEEDNALKYYTLCHELVHGLENNMNPNLSTQSMLDEVISVKNKGSNELLLRRIDSFPPMSLSEGMAEYVAIGTCKALSRKYPAYYDLAVECEQEIISNYQSALETLDNAIMVRDKVQAGEKLSNATEKLFQGTVLKEAQYVLGHRLITETMKKLGHGSIGTLIMYPPETLEEIKDPDLYVERIVS